MQCHRNPGDRSCRPAARARRRERVVEQRRRAGRGRRASQEHRLAAGVGARAAGPGAAEQRSRQHPPGAGAAGPGPARRQRGATSPSCAAGRSTTWPTPPARPSTWRSPCPAVPSSTSPRSTAATSWAPPTGWGGACPTTAPRSARCWSRSAPRAPSGARWSGSRPTPSPTAPRCRAELDTVRARGYAIAVGELEPGLVAVAAPVLDADGRAVAAISISGPQFRIPSDRLDGLGELLTKETETLSARLGHRPAGEGAA